MDEPLGTLDAEFRDLMVRELRELHNRIGATTVYVTHDQLEAMAMADKIAVMNRAWSSSHHPAGNLRPASLDVRGGFHRLAANEFLGRPRGAEEGHARAPRERRKRRGAGSA